jgi:hypothetical protein
VHESSRVEDRGTIPPQSGLGNDVRRFARLIGYDGGMRFRPRFSLRTLLLVVALAAVACWGYWIGWPWWQHHQEIERFIGSVEQVKPGIRAHQVQDRIRYGFYCHFSGIGHWDSAGNTGVCLGYHWDDAFYCVYYEYNTTGLVMGEYDARVSRIELYRLPPLEPKGQSKGDYLRLGGEHFQERLEELQRYLFGNRKINPGFDLTLIYADPPVKPVNPTISD